MLILQYLSHIFKTVDSVKVTITVRFIFVQANVVFKKQKTGYRLKKNDTPQYFDKSATNYRRL